MQDKKDNQDVKTTKKAWVRPQRTTLKKELPQVASSLTTW